MSSVLVSSSNLTNIANAIRTQNGTIQTYTPAQMSEAINSLGYKKMYETTLAATVTSTDATNYATLSTELSSLYTKDKLVYIKVRDVVGPRPGYFFGIDSWFSNYRILNNSTSNVTVGSYLCYRNNSDTTWNTYAGGYGLYPYAITAAGGVIMRTRYHATYTLTVDSTYKIEIFLIPWPFNTSPWEENKPQGE